MIIPLFFQYFPNLSPKKLEPSQAVGLFKAMNVGAQCTVSGPSGTVASKLSLEVVPFWKTQANSGNHSATMFLSVFVFFLAFSLGLGT